MHKLGFPSNKDMITAVESGAITNCPVTAQDIRRAVEIYGQDTSSLKGKATMAKPVAANYEYTPTAEVSTVVLHVDVMFIETEPYLVSVATPLHLTIASSLGGSRAISSVQREVNKHIAMLGARKFSVNTIFTDGEGAIAKMTTELETAGMIVNPAGPNQHVPVVENKIRQIKERVRATLHSLPYVLAASLMTWLVLFSVSRINMMPTTTRADKISL